VADIASLAIEGVDRLRARAKVYFRLVKCSQINELGVAAFSQDVVAEFLALILGQHAIRTSGLVFSVGFSTVDGSISDGKLDLCAHCLHYDGEDWSRLLTRCSRRLDIATPRCLESVHRGDAEVALVGWGVDEVGAGRLNIYLKEPRYGQ